MEAVVFFISAAIILAGGVGVIVVRNPVHAALSLVMTLFGVAVLFVNLEAYFLAVVQVIVYAGAIVVLLLFVIGLELQPARLWRLRTEIFGLGLLQVAITGVAIAALIGLVAVSQRRHRRGRLGDRTSAGGN